MEQQQTGRGELTSQNAGEVCELVVRTWSIVLPALALLASADRTSGVGRRLSLLTAVAPMSRRSCQPPPLRDAVVRLQLPVASQRSAASASLAVEMTQSENRPTTKMHVFQSNET